MSSLFAMWTKWLEAQGYAGEENKRFSVLVVKNAYSGYFLIMEIK